ncbi:hypothetical protein T265_12284 [Opisthorchis viverrini]|uniref:Uncharacterized protein n=1 Tax=Opisthorchis viverrini TaxID=6198 RepID=A0A074YYX9_OPIVI|nr:hypothetical protein T265_12284 [Opisthorchis viverrini]KER18407.1 hypothetical protein T265_12284 [Opisthorchis viverrini]
MPPDNWATLKPQIEYLLSPAFDNRKLKEMTEDIDRIMNEMIPNIAWVPFIDARFFRPSTEAFTSAASSQDTALV